MTSSISKSLLRILNLCQSKNCTPLYSDDLYRIIFPLEDTTYILCSSCLVKLRAALVVNPPIWSPHISHYV